MQRAVTAAAAAANMHSLSNLCFCVCVTFFAFFSFRIFVSYLDSLLAKCVYNCYNTVSGRTKKLKQTKAKRLLLA